MSRFSCVSIDQCHCGVVLTTLVLGCVVWLPPAIATSHARILYNLYGSFNYKLFTHVRSLDPYVNMFRIAELLSDGVIITHCIGIQVLLVYTPLQRLSFILLLLRTFFCFYFSSLPTLELSTEVFCCKPGTYKSCIPLQRFSFIFLFAFYLTCTQSDSGHL